MSLPSKLRSLASAWPEGQTDLENKAKKVLRDAEKAIDDAAREMKKQIKKATGKPGSHNLSPNHVGPIYLSQRRHIPASDLAGQYQRCHVLRSPAEPAFGG